ncbi:MAG: CoA transferase [Burkholderiaceae bacterium]
MSLLRGIKVVEMGLWVAGPAAGGVLADWGADVIKIETPTGDPMRRLFQALSGSRESRCPPFELYNRGKRSIAIDLAAEAGQDLAQRLAGSADVFLTNMRPQYLNRVGLGAEQMRARYPRLVYASLTGYGLTGPDKDAPGFDVAAFSARSGVAFRSTPPGAPPPILAGGMGDNVTAITTVAGIVAALLDRERNGAGHLVGTSLLRTGIYSIGMDVSTRLGLGRIADTPSRRTPQNPLMNPYAAGDGRWLWLIGAESERHWPRIVAALGDQSLATDPRFESPRLRRRNAGELVDSIDALMAHRSRDEWARVFAEHDVWWAPVNTVDDLMTDEQVRAAGAFVTVPGRDGAPAEPGLATPVDFDTDVGPAGPVPGIGEHTTQVLGELGLDDEALTALRAQGVIA